jgi:hypothetical protein
MGKPFPARVGSLGIEDVRFHDLGTRDRRSG